MSGNRRTRITAGVDVRVMILPHTQVGDSSMIINQIYMHDMHEFDARIGIVGPQSYGFDGIRN
jgi:hypothetical protein